MRSVALALVALWVLLATIEFVSGNWIEGGKSLTIAFLLGTMLFALTSLSR